MPRIGHYGSFKESGYVIHKDCDFLVEFDVPLVLPLMLSIVHVQL